MFSLPLLCFPPFVVCLLAVARFYPLFLPLAPVRHSPGQHQRWHGCHKLGLRMVWFMVKLGVSTTGPRKAVLALAIKEIRSNKANTCESCWRIGYTPPSGQFTRYSFRPGRIFLSCKNRDQMWVHHKTALRDQRQQQWNCQNGGRQNGPLANKCCRNGLTRQWIKNSYSSRIQM